MRFQARKTELIGFLSLLVGIGIFLVGYGIGRQVEKRADPVKSHLAEIAESFPEIANTIAKEKANARTNQSRMD